MEETRCLSSAVSTSALKSAFAMHAET